MPEPKQGTREPLEPREKHDTRKRNEAPSVDWAEMLKASMNQSPDESTTETSEYDDLAALLRAQLSKSAAEPSSVLVAEWEIEEGDESDPIDEVEDEEIEETDDSTGSDDFESEYDETDERAEDCFEYCDESKVDDEDCVGSIDDLEATEKEDLFESDDDCEEFDQWDEEPYDAQEDSFVDDDESDDFTDYESEINTRSNELIAKEILDRAFEEERVEASTPISEEIPPTGIAPPFVPSAPSAPHHAYARPTTEAWTDDRINGAVRFDGIAGNHLRDLAMENQRLITESEQSFGEVLGDASADAVSESPENVPSADGSENAAASEPKRGRLAATPQTRDPLQLGLDDISPTVRATDPSVRQKNEKTVTSAFLGDLEETHSDYTARMAHNREKEAALADTELFLGMGYEDVLRSTDEQNRVELLREEADEQRRESTFEIPSVQVGEEYRGRNDTARVEKAYLRGRRRNVARLVVAAVGALVALFYDLVPMLLSLFGDHLDSVWGTSLGEISFADSLYYVPIGMTWTILICLPFLTRLGRGIRSLMNFEPTRYAVSAIALTVALAGGGFAWYVGDPYELPLFGGAALFMLMVAALSELLVTEGEYRGFSAVSAGKDTCMLTDDPTSASIALEEQTKQEGKSRGERDRRIFTVVRTGRIADYFARTQRYNPYMGRLNYLLPVALLVAIVCAGLALALGGEVLTDGVRAFVTAYLVCLPSAYLIALTLPLCTANGYLRQKGSAIIGSAAPVDYAAKEGIAHLIYEDGDALKALHRMNINLRGDPRSDEYRRIANVVFRLLNTPLADDPILREERLDHYRIEISERGDQYIRLYLVDTRKGSATEIMMGSHSALTRRGVRLPRVSMEKQYKKNERCQVMYLAFNRNFHLAYGVEYRVGRSFGHMVASLNDLGYEVDIATYDPMFDPAMQGLVRLRKRNRVEVLRPQNFDAIRKVRSCGIVATGRSLDLQYPLSACCSMLAAYRRGGLWSWISLPIGISVVALAVCLGLTGLLSSALVVLWQLISMGVTLWIARAATLAGIPGRESRQGRKKTQKSQQKKSTSARR